MVYPIPFFVAAALIFFVSVFVYRRRKVRGSWYLILLCIAASIWTAAEGLLYLNLSATVNIFINHLQYLGIAPLPPLALLFTISFFGHDALIARMRLNLLLVVAALIIALVFTNPFHHLVFSDFYTIKTASLAMTGLKHGVLWYYILEYHYFLLAGLSFLLIFKSATSTGFYRFQAILFLVAVMIVWGANVVYITGNSPVPNMDISPVAFTVVAGVMAWSFFRYKFLDILPVARTEIFYKFDYGIMVLDQKHRILDMNLAAEALFDITLKETLGLSAFQVLHAFPQLCDLLSEIDPGEAIISIDQNRRIFDISVSPIKDPRDNVQGIVITFRDVTERRKVEEELIQSKEEYRALSKMLRLMCDNVPDMIWAKDLEKRFIFANKAVCQTILGISDVTALLEKTNRFFSERQQAEHPDDPNWYTLGEVCEDSDTITMKTRMPGRFEECENIRGRFVCLDVYKTPLFNEKGEMIGTVGSARDITAHKQAEIALRESEERFRMLLNDVSMVSVQGYTKEGSTLYWNEGSCRLYGYTATEAIGKSIYDLIVPLEMHDAFAATIEKMIDTRLPAAPFEIELMHKDGFSIPVYTSHCILERQGHALELFCIGVDLRKIRNAEQEREKLQEQLNQARKMEAIGRLAGGVAHDFNNMLGVILAQTELAMAEMAPEENLYSRLSEIRKAAQRSAELTRQLLTFARKQTIEPMVMNLNKKVENTLHILWPLIGENIELSWRAGKNLWTIRIDPSQVDQILTNLSANARDAISGSGNITIETSNKTLDEEQCSLYAGAVAGEYVCLAVNDNGCGMEREIVKKIFDPFFTTKNIGKGTGLGLATVYGVVTQNGGFISVDSEPGRGTRIMIFLPRHFAEIEKDELLSESESVAEGGKTVMLVEDEPMILDVTTTMLEQLGYTVLAAGTPKEAADLVETHAGQIHLLMTDVVMPEMNGRELAENISFIYPEIRQLFMSGYTSNIIASHGVLDRGFNFIQKPFTMKALAEKLYEVFAKDTPPVHPQ